MEPLRSKTRIARFFSLQNTIALLVLGVCIATGIWVISQSHINWSQPEQITQLIQQQGIWGVLFYIGFVIVAIVVSVIPSTPATIAAGAIWGPMTAGIYAVIGISVGSLLAYFIGRTLGRSAMRALTGKVIYFSTHRGDRYIGWLIFVVHLLPVLPYELMSYAAGTSGISLSIYARSAFLGIIPCAFLLTFIGSSISIGFPVLLAFLGLFITVLALLTWGIKRHNWLGLRDVIRVEPDHDSSRH
ncbi:MAG: TVP38/TMEM64 family protein [Drouetiella hepatica Uher 2000/2452]|uniref:TVP38/TMEM64 family membrane protein n=1 Tax=Drouetiella hepatica Uher 2000/2452 TaxID=904376 RepID=A0A951UMX4_9CYAN|nr:TVP38/TMEM64 family protein [Drouetiella hepatica Uher 2000/2452]